jgi:alginate O-acetyltransferase complex protein AlgI
VFSYAMQLYFDFSAYSDMAVGLGLLFGFRLPWNFDAPYQAADPAEFWRRWHMSLSTWLRDYLYIPLGGSRASTLLVARNLAVVMFLGGLWHGAAWTFVLWGVYHGLLLAGNALVERSVRPALAVPRIYRVALTFLLVCAGWALFRSPSLSSALDVLAALGGARGLASGLAADLLTQNLAACMTLIVAAGMAFTLPDTLHWRIPQRRPVAVLSGVALAVCTLLFVRPSPFLYFQF